MPRRVASLAMLFVALLARPVVAGEACSGCETLGSLSVALASIDPPAPLIGQQVTFTFAVEARLPGGVDCGFGQCQLIGGPPVLEGSEPAMPGATGLQVRRQAAAAGVATVEFVVSAMTEEACRFLDPENGCQTVFRFVPIQASTGPIEVEVLAPATPTPTPTPTPTMAAPVEDDGCAVVRPTSSGGAPLLLAPLLLLALWRHRQRPCGRGQDARATGGRRPPRSSARETDRPPVTGRRPRSRPLTAACACGRCSRPAGTRPAGRGG